MSMTRGPFCANCGRQLVKPSFLRRGWRCPGCNRKPLLCDCPRPLPYNSRHYDTSGESGMP